jgi:hypothetical protein
MSTSKTALADSKELKMQQHPKIGKEALVNVPPLPRVYKLNVVDYYSAGIKQASRISELYTCQLQTLRHRLVAVYNIP